jgi:3-hydroxyisobutyrate dehydrogenase-like beta-hydroxyacid dehydrogenase
LSDQTGVRHPPPEEDPWHEIDEQGRGARSGDLDGGRGGGFVDEGLGWRDTPREVAEAADVVFTSVPNDAVLESVASGPDGILAGLGEGKVWVDMSTVSPHASREVAERVQARGAAMLDAPVSGSIPQV